MNEPETQQESTSDFAFEELQEEVQSLRTLVSVTLIVLIVFTLCVDWFLYVQASGLRARLKQDEATINRITASAADFWNKFTEYGKTHPDFAPVLEKNKPNFVSNYSAPAPVPGKQK